MISFPTIDNNTVFVKTVGLDEKSDHTIQIRVLVLVILQGELEVVVNVTSLVLGETKPVARLVLDLVSVRHFKSCSARQIVHNEMHKVLVANPVVDFLAFLGLPYFICAKNGAL